jgi:hypothetical protein
MLAHAAALAGLAFRRALTRELVLAIVVLLVLWPFVLPDAHRASPVLDANAALLAARREATWFGLAFLLLPVFLYRAAATGRHWNDGDREWLGARPVAPYSIVLGAWFGLWFAGALLAVVVTLWAEQAAKRGGLTHRMVRAVPCLGTTLVGSDERRSWEVEDPGGALRHGRSLRLALATAPGAGPTARVRLTCERTSPTSPTSPTPERSAVEAIVAGRTSFDLALPSGDGGVRLTLEKLGAGCTIVLQPNALRLVEPAAGPSAGARAALGRALLFLGAWTALALGFGTWMSTGTATALLLALLLPSGVATAFGELWPAAGMPGAVSNLGEGLVPAALPAGALVGVLAAAGIGLVLARFGLEREPRP